MDGGGQSGARAAAPIDVTVHEGTSMSVAISPDGRTLAIDLQGSIWTLPAAGGAAQRITDVFDDARQPAWSPDGKHDRLLRATATAATTSGRSSPDGKAAEADLGPVRRSRAGVVARRHARRVFVGPWRSRRAATTTSGSSTRASGELTQLTNDPAEDFMPTWSPDDQEIAFVSTRETGSGLGGERGRRHERKVVTAEGRVDAPSWGPGGQIVYHVTERQREPARGRRPAVTATRTCSPFRAAWASPTDFVYVSDGKIRKRALTGARRRPSSSPRRCR